LRQLKIATQITVREKKSITAYFNDINKYPLIEADQEAGLAIRIKEGDQIALQKLINGNLRFVVSVAKQYQNKGISLEDLISEGNIGLVKAATRFDHTKGFKFISYAVWWIRQSIMQSLGEDARQIRLPQNQIGSLRKINAAIGEFLQKNDREPTTQELCDITEISKDKIAFLRGHSFSGTSMDASLDGQDDSFSLHNILSSDNSTDSLVMKESLSSDLEMVMNKLTPRQAEVIKRVYGMGYYDAQTLEEVAENLGLSKERVRQIKERTLRKIRANDWSKLLRDYI
tara:strand:+ start:516 stop:1373 length:858 start_codon:yes stop_codon:yes gene_type:complete